MTWLEHRPCPECGGDGDLFTADWAEQRAAFTCRECETLYAVFFARNGLHLETKKVATGVVSRDGEAPVTIYLRMCRWPRLHPSFWLGRHRLRREYRDRQSVFLDDPWNCYSPWDYYGH